MFEKLVAAGGTFDGISKGVFSATRMRLEVSRTWDGYRLYMGARTMDADPAFNGRVHWNQMVVVNTPTLVKIRRAMGNEVSGGYSNWEFRTDAHGRLAQVVASWDSFLPDITTTVKFAPGERPVQDPPTAKAAVDTDPFSDLASRP
jgi:hypothetical protein